MQDGLLDRLSKVAKNGDPLMVSLREGAEWYSGWTPAPTINLTGFDPPKDLSQLKDDAQGVYIAFMYEIRIKDSVTRHGVTQLRHLVTTQRALSFGDTVGAPRGGPVHKIYFDEQIIYSVRSLVSGNVLRNDPVSVQPAPAQAE